MRLSADQLIFWQHGFFKLNGTIVFTWGLMLVLAVGSKLITRRLSTDLKRSRWQNLLEIIVTGIEKQISDVGLKHPEKYIGFLGTLFLFVALAALCTEMCIRDSCCLRAAIFPFFAALPARACLDCDFRHAGDLDFRFRRPGHALSSSRPGTPWGRICARLDLRGFVRWRGGHAAF